MINKVICNLDVIDSWFRNSKKERKGCVNDIFRLRYSEYYQFEGYLGGDVWIFA